MGHPHDPHPRPRDRLVSTSPCEGTKQPKKVPIEIRPLSTATVHALVDAVPDRYPALVVLAAGTGVRQGECSGLTGTRLDLDEPTLRVEQQLIAPRSPGRSGARRSQRRAHPTAPAFTISPLLRIAASSAAESRSGPCSGGSATPPPRRSLTPTRTCGRLRRPHARRRRLRTRPATTHDQRLDRTSGEPTTVPRCDAQERTSRSSNVDGSFVIDEFCVLACFRSDLQPRFRSSQA